MNYTSSNNLLSSLMNRLRNDQRGQNTLEFGFAIVVLLSLTFGMIDFGRAVFIKSVIDAASQEGARQAIVAMDNRGVDIAVTEAATRERMIGLDPSSAVIDVVQSDTEMVNVTVTYDFRFITPLAAAVLGGQGGTIELVGNASMLGNN